ncbi:MAG: hypothetical protein EPN30_07970 [Actinomycetota bacterium]|nr:MAG: hypothetical protein EPN30_07970 [Actinomycetota bacterium]
MDQSDDYSYDMEDEALSEQLIEQLLQGKVDPLKVSGAVAHLATLIEAAKMEASSEELAQERVILSRFKEALGEGGVRMISHGSRRKARSSIMAAKTLGALIAASALTGTAVAAYHGELPNSFQSTVATGLAKVGVSVPTSNISGSQTTSSSIHLPDVKSTSAPSGTRSGASNGTDEGLASGSSLFGLCTAYINSQNSESVSTTTAPATTTTLASGAAPQTGSTSSTSPTSANGFTGSTQYQRLQITAQQKGETVKQLCSSVNIPSQHQGSTTSTVMNENSHASSHANSHAAFYNSSTSTTLGLSLTASGNQNNLSFNRTLGKSREGLHGDIRR